MKNLFISIALAFISFCAVAQQYIAINAVALSTGPHYTCSTSTATINTYVGCINAVHAGNVVTVSGNTVTVNINYTLPGPVCLGALSYPVQVVSLTNLPSGSVSLVVNGNWNGVTQSTMTTTLSVVSCCPSQADAGTDTSLCDMSQITLNANTVPSFATGSWTVASGGASLSSMTNPNAIASNLSYGVNKLVWTTVDSICTTSDTLEIINSETPTSPVTELDRFSCYDSTTISANVILVGNGNWKSQTPGVAIVSKSKPTSKVHNLTKSTNVLTWTSSNGACNEVDTLLIDHSVIVTAPTITANGLVLTSTSAPSYQWFLDQSMISGATNQSYTATANGEYRVRASESGCDNGVLSNIIEITGVGINDLISREISIGPNPSRGFVAIENTLPGTQVSLFDVFGKEILNALLNGSKHTLDLSMYNNGVYFVRITNGKIVLTEKLLLSK